MVRAAGLFLLAAVLEIGGGYLVWIWLRGGRNWTFGIIGFVFLATYGVIPVFQAEANPFGRIYAAYGAVFIAMSLAWGWAIDGIRPDYLDWIGGAICLVGTTVLMWPRN
jgi:small multidrug resistance family-3 protein